MRSALLQRAPAPTPAKAELRGEMPAKQPRWLTEAAACTVHGVRGMAEAIACALGVRVARVYEVADINAAKPLPAWFIPTLVRITGSFAVLDALEAQVGRVAFPLPVTTGGATELHRSLARQVQAFGEFLTEAGTDIADGRVTPEEWRRLRPALDCLIAQLAEFRTLAERQSEAA